MSSPLLHSCHTRMTCKRRTEGTCLGVVRRSSHLAWAPRVTLALHRPSVSGRLPHSESSIRPEGTLDRIGPVLVTEPLRVRFGVIVAAILNPIKKRCNALKFGSRIAMNQTATISGNSIPSTLLLTCVPDSRTAWMSSRIAPSTSAWPIGA